VYSILGLLLVKVYFKNIYFKKQYQGSKSYVAKSMDHFISTQYNTLFDFTKPGCPHVLTMKDYVVR